MTSHDVRDMLDLPGTAGPRPAKKQKLAAPKAVLKGLAREVAGLAGDAPVAIVPEITLFKKKRILSRKPAARWVLQPFKNSAREDDLVLRHWRRKPEKRPIPVEEEGAQAEAEQNTELEVEDSTFAKFNVHVQVPQYDDEQYNSTLISEDWPKDETDYLMGLVQEYDLRWPVIWDRYEYSPPAPQGDVPDDAMVLSSKPRSMEDMKKRYYDIAAKVMALNKHPSKMSNSEFMIHELMANFNAAQETNRKRFAEAVISRTKEEASEEQSLLLELKRILARSEKLSEERKELYALLEAPPSTGNIGMFTTSQGLQQLLQQLMTVDKSKKRKSLMGSDGISPSAGPSGPQQLNLDRRDSTNRESISGPSGPNNKKGGPQGQSERRQLTEEEERMYGVTHHERITTSGPAFRHEKISKPIASRSVIQQQKIMNTLAELKIPSRLIMPTAEVGAAFDGLLNSIHTMLEAKKVSDKLTGEINLMKAQKWEREKKERAERGEPEPPGTEGANGDGDYNAAEQEGIDDVSVKVEDGDADKEKSVAASTRAGSVHKRSASVLSAVSDKSTKRQKK